MNASYAIAALTATFLLFPGYAATDSPKSPLKATAEDFKTQFENPPAPRRILKIIHSWPDEPGVQDQLISALSTQGFGGVVCNVSFADYLENESRWKGFQGAVEKAHDAGFAMWLYDEKGYPSGTAGGLVLREHPEWEADGLLIADKESGPGSVSLALPPGRLFLAAAFSVTEGKLDLKSRVELTGHVRERKLSWQAGPGRWRVMVITESRLFEGTHANQSLSDHIPYPNLLQAAPTARFLGLTHERYAQHLGSNLGRFFVSTFTDEPSLMSLFLRPMPYRVLPWSPEMAVEFKKRRGYALEPMVPALIADCGPESQKSRYDYWQTIAELVSENFFGQIQNWCHAHHILSGGHLLMEENPVNHVPLYGDFFRCLRRLDAPSIDCLTSIPDQVPWFIARMASSAAELENKSVTMCETSDHSQRYRPPGDSRPIRKVAPEEIRGTCNRLIAGGIDTITSYYSFDGLSDEQLRQLNLWVGRCCASLKGGHQVADIAVVYPIQSIWTRFTPARHYANESPPATEVENLFRDVSDGLFEAGRDFTYVDARALAEAIVEPGVLVHGNLRWRVVVLPGVDTLPQKAWENLSSFVKSGGVLIAAGAVPANTESEFPSRRVQEFGRETFGPATGRPQSRQNQAGGVGILLPPGCSSLVPAIMDQILEPDVSASMPQSRLRTTHRRIDNHEVYFLINDGKNPFKGNVSLCASGAGELCEPETGAIHSVASGNSIALDLPAYGAALLRFPGARLPGRRKLNDDLLPNRNLSELPQVTPIIARGEFVQENVARSTQGFGGTTNSGWQITGKITKGQVDTFLFARFIFAKGIELRAADSLVLDTWVPEKQSASTQLLIILHQKNGADYLASSGRMLGIPGHNEVYVPLTRFQLAGWSNDPEGHLNLSSITEIRVGWGGYYGVEGENIQFTMAGPWVASVSSQ